VRLGDLLAVLPATPTGWAPDGGGSVDVAGISHDSRTVRTGDLFCCVPGAIHDGHDHAASAVAAGAVAVLAERPLGDDRLTASGVPVVVVPSVRRAMPLLAASVHGHPSDSLDLVGVTGTNGKTSVVHLLGAVLEAASRRTATWGTLSGPRTTPESTELQATLAGWASQGVEAAAIEVSSHALAQHRVDGIRFAAVAFTTLGRDHLDFHGSMDAYEAAKARLFDGTFASRTVVAVGDEAGRRMAARAERQGMEVVAVDPMACDARPTAIGTEMRWKDRTVSLSTGGAFTAANALVAAELAVLLGVDPDDVVAGLAAASPVPGRFEPVYLDGGPRVVVDYAHTPDALAAALGAARQVVPAGGRLVVTFGCGGDRDRGKRPEMGLVAEAGADRVVVTSDNPRGEPPEVVIADILSGMERSPDHVEPDRRRAIAEALRSAGPDDLVVVAGRGHESMQEMAGGTVPFDDRVVVAEEWARLGSRSGEEIP